MTFGKDWKNIERNKIKDDKKNPTLVERGVFVFDFFPPKCYDFGGIEFFTSFTKEPMMAKNDRMDSTENRGVGETRVQEVRALIATGKYPVTDAEEALDQAVDRLIKEQFPTGWDQQEAA